MFVFNILRMVSLAMACSSSWSTLKSNLLANRTALTARRASTNAHHENYDPKCHLHIYHVVVFQSQGVAFESDESEDQLALSGLDPRWFQSECHNKVHSL